MMVGELVLPEVMRGMADASITRRPWKAAHPQALVEDGERVVVRAHAGGADRMEDGHADLAGRLHPARRPEARWAPGWSSSGLNRARGSCATMRRVMRSASTATRRSSSVER